MREARWSWLALAVLGALGCSGDTTRLNAHASSQGEANFRLELETGIEVDSLEVVLTLPDASIDTFTIDTKDSQAVTIGLGSLAPGQYSVTLRATTTLGSPCSGSADFRIEPDTTTSVPLTVVCRLPPMPEGRAEIDAEFVVQQGSPPAAAPERAADAGLPEAPR